MGNKTIRKIPIIGEEIIIGYTDRETVKLDIDSARYKQVKSAARWLMERYELSDFIILRSSDDNYHVVFNRTVTWEENMHIIGFASYMLRNERGGKKSMGWVIMQLIKESSTLRISTKGKKPRPRIIYKEGEQDREIATFRAYREKFGRFH